LAPLTERSAVLGKASLMLPSPGFWIAPAPIETLPAVAPFSRATGLPPMRRQEPPQRLFDTDSRFPPEPPKATSPPPMLASDPPLTERSGPLRSDTMLPVRTLSKAPATFRPLPPATLTRAPMATASRLASTATRVDPAVSRLRPLGGHGGQRAR